MDYHTELPIFDYLWLRWDLIRDEMWSVILFLTHIIIILWIIVLPSHTVSSLHSFTKPLVLSLALSRSSEKYRMILAISFPSNFSSSLAQIISQSANQFRPMSLTKSSIMVFLLAWAKCSRRNRKSKLFLLRIRIDVRCLPLVFTSINSNNSLRSSRWVLKTLRFLSSTCIVMQKYDLVFGIALAIKGRSSLFIRKTVLWDWKRSLGNIQGFSAQISQTQKNQGRTHQVLYAQGL